MTTTQSYSENLHTKLAPTLACEGTSYADKSKKCLANLFVASVSAFEIVAFSSARAASVPYHKLRGREFVVMNDQVRSAVNIFSNITGYNENTLNKNDICKTLNESKEKALSFADSHKVEIGIAMCAAAMALSLYITSNSGFSTDASTNEYFNPEFSFRGSTSSATFQSHQSGNIISNPLLHAVSSNPGTSLLVTTLFASSFAFFLSALYLHRNQHMQPVTSESSSSPTSSSPTQIDSKTTTITTSGSSSTLPKEKTVSKGDSPSDVSAKKTTTPLSQSTANPPRGGGTLLNRFSTVAFRGLTSFVPEKSGEWLKKPLVKKEQPLKQEQPSTANQKTSTEKTQQFLEQEHPPKKEKELSITRGLRKSVVGLFGDQPQDQPKKEDPVQERDHPLKRIARNQGDLNTKEFEAIQVLKMFDSEFVQDQPLDQAVTNNVLPPAPPNALPSSLFSSTITTTGTTLSGSTNQVTRKRKKKKHRSKSSKQRVSRDVMKETVSKASNGELKKALGRLFPKDTAKQEFALEELKMMVGSTSSSSSDQASTTSTIPQQTAPFPPNAPAPPKVSTRFSSKSSSEHTSGTLFRNAKQKLHKVTEEEFKKFENAKQEAKNETDLLATVCAQLLPRRDSMVGSDSEEEEEGVDWE